MIYTLAIALGALIGCGRYIHDTQKKKYQANKQGS